jgi:hypothetical protein
MAIGKPSISELILNQLAVREMRQLSLTVAVRKTMDKSVVFKGDLSETVKAALRKLVLAKEVDAVEGVYSLAER